MDRQRLGTRIPGARKQPAAMPDPNMAGGQGSAENLTYGYYQPQMAYPDTSPQLYPNLPPPSQTYAHTTQYSEPHPPQQASGDYYMSAFQVGQGVVNDQMANLAMAYGQSLVGQGKQIMDQKLEKYVTVSKLKYYFAVDTTYVRRKLTLVIFPFTNTDWSMKYNQEQAPVAPRYETNAPDLYIPVMAFVTFILMAGIALGVQNKFSPEQLGIHASSTLGWLILEVLILLMTTYIMNISTDLNYLDIIAFCSYKYVGMIAIVCAGLVFLATGYYLTLAYFSLALCFFLVKALRIQVSSKILQDVHVTHGNKRRMYFILCITVLQPLLMFWLTRHLMITQPSISTSNAPVN